MSFTIQIIYLSDPTNISSYIGILTSTKPTKILPQRKGVYLYFIQAHIPHTDKLIPINQVKSIFLTKTIMPLRHVSQYFAGHDIANKSIWFFPDEINFFFQ